jgi:hypothetical protein
MQHNSSAMPVDEETREQRSMEYDEDPMTIVGEIVQPKIPNPIIDDDHEPSSGGFIVMDGRSTSQYTYEEIAPNTYAPLAIRREDVAAPYRTLDLNFSSGGEIAAFHGEYLASSQELLRQIQSGSVTPSDSFAIPGTPTAPPDRQKGRYLSKLQFGGILAACLVLGAAIYACLNPSILAPLTTKVATVSPSTPVNVGQSIQSPNLAANEFTPLSLNGVETIAAPPTSSTPNVSIATEAAPNTPVAIPYNPATSQLIPPTGNVVRVKLADSLIKSLLPPNFQSAVKPAVKNRPKGMK